jgi:hypothetical protein
MGVRTPAAIAVIVLIAVASASAAGGATVQVPRSGIYSGHTEADTDIEISISGKSVEYVAFAFECKKVIGRASLQDFQLRESRRGYKLSLDAHSGVTYEDDELPPDNAAVSVDGRFTRGAKRASGTLEVAASQCETGPIAWHVHRA